MTRKNTFYLLIFLTGITAVAQYVVQGVLATTHNPLTFPDWFWIAEFSLWGGRALIEAWIIAFLFSTESEKTSQKAIITIFEIVLLVMIAFTVGYSLRAVGYATKEGWTATTYSMMLESLKEPGFTYWTLGIGAYTAIMMAAAGTAYRVQPFDIGGEGDQSIRELEDELERAYGKIDGIDIRLKQAHEKIRQYQEQEQALEATMISLRWLDAQNATTIARVIAFACENGNRPAPKGMADLLGVTPSTIVRAYDTKDKLLKELE